MGLLDYPWSSLVRGYAVAPGKREKWVAVREGLKLFGYGDRSPSVSNHPILTCRFLAAANRTGWNGDPLWRR